MIWLLAILCFQEHHYVDGVTIYLKSGEVYKTLSEVREDRLFYTWQEEGELIAIEKRTVQSLEYFTMRVPGRKPYEASRSQVQRRISGASIVYRRDGDIYLKCRHVDERGRSLEGMGAPNYVKAIKQIPSDSPERIALVVQFSKTSPDYDVAVRFYNMEGRLLAESFIDGASLPRKVRRNELHETRLAIPASVDLGKLGLVEIARRKLE